MDFSWPNEGLKKKQKITNKNIAFIVGFETKSREYYPNQEQSSLIKSSLLPFNHHAMPYTKVNMRKED
jgi:hypothetical protein